MSASTKGTWMFTIAGAIIAAIHFWFLGILAVIFIALSKKEFA